MSKVSYSSTSTVMDGDLNQNLSMANIDDRARSITGSTTSYLVRAGDYFREDLESRNIIKLLPDICRAPATKCFVLVEASSRAIFTGCVFRSDFSTGAMNGTGTVVQSLAPAAGSVFVGAGCNFTTHSHGTTVTVYAAEIT